jgi:hypothetical protein
MQATKEELIGTVKAKIKNIEEITKARIKEIDEELEDAYHEHLQARFNDGAYIGADFDIWTCKNCLSFDDWYNEESDADLCEELEGLRSILEIETGGE